MVIASGVHAWKALTQGQGPLWRRFNEGNERPSSKQSLEDVRPDQKEDTVPDKDLPEDWNKSQGSKCPFSAMAQLNRPHDGTPVRRRPESLPTPPSVQGHFSGSPLPSESRNNSLSPPPSVTGSASKCPIRMLDERSPEEIAEYFETHKHEIPRSHEICVKRYQSNTESIRQLDAKYGSLVNMIQGLGMKHQPLLPAKENEEDFAEMDAKSAKKVAKWAGNVTETRDVEALAGQEDLPTSSIEDTEERQGHFDKPLKEIRVGESPSRPWGISVPVDIPPFTDLDEGEAMPTPKGTKAKADPRAQAKKASNTRPEAEMAEKPQMVFTGPVFIGYGAEQAAELIKKCGWEPQGPDKGND